MCLLRDCHLLTRLWMSTHMGISCRDKVFSTTNKARHTIAFLVYWNTIALMRRLRRSLIKLLKLLAFSAMISLYNQGKEMFLKMWMSLTLSTITIISIQKRWFHVCTFLKVNVLCTKLFTLIQPVLFLTYTCLPSTFHGPYCLTLSKKYWATIVCLLFTCWWRWFRLSI